MADPGKTSYPTLPAKVWWSLRDRFKRTLPTAVTPSYVATALSMSERSAMNNVIPGLRRINLIDDDGKPTGLAVSWRDDGQYRDACDRIVKEVYPQELLDLGTDDRSGLQGWFARNGHVGESAAGKMAALYLLLREGDLSKATTSGENKPKKSRSAVRSSTAGLPQQTRAGAAKNETSASARAGGATHPPQIHFDIQLHISPEATAEQIDAIFASMAKHLSDLL